jgi:hypothetical protein
MMLGLSLSVPLAIGTVTPALADTMSPSPEPTLEETPEAPEAPEESSAPTESPSELEEPEDDPTPEETENSEEPQALQSDTNAGSGVVVTELTNGGPGGYHDNFIEITNTSDEAVDVTGWEVYRCTGSGSRASGPQVTLEGEIEAGGIILLAREASSSTLSDDEVDYRYGTSFANNSYGAAIVDAEGETVDSVAVKDPSVSGDACAEGTALANVTNSALGESWQRVDDTDNSAEDFILAPRTPGAENATEPSPEPLRGDVLVSEIAHTDAAGTSLVELGNYGDQAVDISGWSIGTCNQFGRHFNGDAYTYASDMPADTIEPGEALVVEMDDDFSGFVDGAAGVILYDNNGAIVDRVALADGQDSACAEGEPLPYFSLDVDADHSYQRTDSTGNNAEDFVAAVATPGELEAGEPVEDEADEEEFLSTTGGANVLVSEMTNTGPEGNGDIFFEIVNYGDEAQDLTGWSVYRCVGTGVRASVPQLSTDQLNGVILEPGQRITAGRSGQAGPEIVAASDYFFDISFAAQYGLIIFDEHNNVVDRVGSSRHDVESYCANGSPLPGSLSGIHEETWQRVDITGDAQNDFIAAPRTPGRVNTTETVDHHVDSTVRFTEITNGGPGGAGDNFVEITNLGDEPVDVSGWEMYRCVGTGRVYNDTHQFDMPDGTLEPGEVFVAARSGSASTIDNPDTEYHTSFNANAGFGVMLVDENRGIVDSVGVFTRVDSACTQGEPLPNNLDFDSAQSYQRVADTGNNAEDFIRAVRTPGEHEPEQLNEIQWPAETEAGDLLINEVAGGGVNGHEDQFVEIINNGEEAYDLSGYQLFYCSTDGRRMPNSQITVPDGMGLEPGSVLTLTGPGSDFDGDASTDAVLPRDGFGVSLLDDAGNPVDRVGVFYDDVGLVTNAPDSACSDGIPLDRRLGKVSPEAAWKHGLSYHRVQNTQNNIADFVPAEATPGNTDGPEYHDPTQPRDGWLDPVQVDRAQRTELPELSDAAAGDTTHNLTLEQSEGSTSNEIRGGQLADIDWENSRAFTGASDEAPLPARTGEDETEVDNVQEIPAAEDSAYEYPYQRFELAVGEPDSDTVDVAWTGSALGRHELQLYVYNQTEGAWELAAAQHGEDGEKLTLIGTVNVADTVAEGTLNMLVQHGPRTQEAFSDAEEPNQQLKTPGEYDFAIGHITDSQYLLEQNPESFTEMNSWFAANHEARDIAFVMHTGDLIQNWLRGDQEDDRGRYEFELASKMQEILEDADVPHSVLPGNHDNVWGATNALFDEYFPVERYEDASWFGEAGPEGIAAHYDIIEQDGVKLLFLSLPYDSSEEQLVWAEEVIESHPDHNVILGTHEYLRPEIDERANPQNGRWVSQGDVFFERLVEPHSNVVMTMSGHLHGVRQRVIEREDGTAVVETVADYQSYEHDDARDAMFFRLYQIDVGSGQMAINAYHPGLDSYTPYEYDPRGMGYTAESDELTMPITLLYDKRVDTAGIQVLEAPETIDTVDLAAGDSASVTWEDLTAETDYGWYTLSSTPEQTTVGFMAAMAPQDDAEGDDPRFSAVQTFTASAVSDNETPEPTPEPTEEPTGSPEPGADGTGEPTESPTDPSGTPTDPAPTDPAAPAGSGEDSDSDVAPQAGTDSSTSGGLASTGAQVTLLVLVGAAILLLGLILVLRHRRSTDA